MKVHVVAAVLVLTSIAPALAQTNPQKTQRSHVVTRSIAIFGARVQTAPAPRVYTSSCGPYLGGWQEGYPGTSRC
jgi:hypothetical protein